MKRQSRGQSGQKTLGGKTPSKRKPPASEKSSRGPRRVQAELLVDNEESETEDREVGSDDVDSDDVASDDVASDDEEIESNLPVPSKGSSDHLPKTTDSDFAAISPTDPLRRYLEELSRHPLLSPEQEFELALKLRDQGDLSAAKALVTANLRLVVRIAFEYRNIYSNILDLVQEGNVGLMKAVSKFDPTKGARLGYYASWWIRSYILKYLLDNFRLVRVGTTQAQKKLFYHLMREKARMEAQGLLAAPKLLAEKLEVREKDVIEMEQRLSGRGAEMSLDSPVNADSENRTTHVELLADEHESADESLARSQLLELLRGKLPAFTKLLNEKEQKVFKERLLAEDPKTLQEIADQYGLTRERARQIEAKVVQKLRDFLKPYLGS